MKWKPLSQVVQWVGIAWHGTEKSASSRKGMERIEARWQEPTVISRICGWCAMLHIVIHCINFTLKNEGRNPFRAWMFWNLKANDKNEKFYDFAKDCKEFAAIRYKSRFYRDIRLVSSTRKHRPKSRKKKSNSRLYLCNGKCAKSSYIWRSQFCTLLQFSFLTSFYSLQSAQDDGLQFTYICLL